MATPEKTERNDKIYNLHLKGESYWTIAKKYDLTPQRIGAIVVSKRKNLASNSLLTTLKKKLNIK